MSTISIEETLARVQAKLELERGKISEVYRTDFLKFAEENLIVKPKEIHEGYKNFILFPAQLRIHTLIEEQIKRRGRARVIILKARQQGISTYTAGRTYWKTTTNSLYQSVVITHRSDTTKLLYEMTKRFYELQPEEFKPKQSSANRDGMAFEGIDSSYHVYTAGSKSVGRGTTPTILHASEVAFWPDADELISGLFQGVANVEGTEIIIESTANGSGDAFHRLWKDAVKNYKDGEGEWLPIFIPWFEEPKYFSDVPADFERTHEEDAYALRYDLTDAQLMFRREKAAGGREELFKQEYPSNADEAFLIAGSSVFNQEALSDIITEKPARVEDWKGSPSLTFDVSPVGNTEIWSHPEMSGEYIIGADVSNGVGQDYSCAVVMNKEFDVLALYRDNTINPGAFGEMLFYLGRRYNNALIVCESNGPGTATLNQLSTMQYSNIYHRTKIMQISKDVTSQPGFQTNMATKPHIISGLGLVIRDRQIGIPSEVMLNELRSYISKDSGKMTAPDGGNDDTIIAAALCIEGLRTHGDKLSATVNWASYKWDGQDGGGGGWL